MTADLHSTTRSDRVHRDRYGMRVTNRSIRLLALLATKPKKARRPSGENRKPE